MDPRSDDPNPGSWCLRFLGGALKGRTIALKLGPNVVGSSGECDIMLPGGEVLPRHLIFNAGELVVVVQKIGNALVRLNGEEMQQARRSLVVGDTLALGQIELQLELSYPTAPRDVMFAGPESVVPGSGVPRTAPGALQGTSFHVGLLLALLSGLGGLGTWISGQVPPAGGDFGARLADVEQAVAPFGEAEVVAAPGGQLAVRGFVETRERRQALQQSVQRFRSAVTVRVYAADKLVEEARRYVGAPGIAIAYAGKGRLLVTGTGDDTRVREKVRRLGEDLYPAVIVSDKVQYRPAPAIDTDARQRDREREQWAAWQELLPARLVGITDGEGLRSIQLANGNRYYEGAVLKSGTELERIDADGLVLRAAKGAPARK